MSSAHTKSSSSGKTALCKFVKEGCLVLCFAPQLLFLHKCPLCWWDVKTLKRASAAPADSQDPDVILLQPKPLSFPHLHAASIWLRVSVCNSGPLHPSSPILYNLIKGLEKKPKKQRSWLKRRNARWKRGSAWIAFKMAVVRNGG